MSGSDKTGTISAKQQMLLELLYGELTADAAESAERELESDSGLSADLAAYRRMRGLMADLPEEDPPAAISAQLVHAASQRKVPRASGWLSSLRTAFRPLMLHPGMTAAASLIVVAGVAGTLYITGNSQVAQPAVESESPAPAPESRSERDPVPLGIPRSDTRSSAPALIVEPKAKTGIPTTGTLVDRPEFSELENATKRRRKPARQRTAPNSPQSGATTPRDKSVADDLEMKSKTSRAGARKQDRSTPPAQSKPRRPAAGYSAKEDGDDRSASVQRLFQQAQRALDRGDCTLAGTLSAKIRGIDPTFYRERLQRDKRFAACRNPRAKTQ